MTHVLPSERKDLWPLILFGIHLGYAFFCVYLYPQHLYETDLIAYFIYFRNWLAQSFALHSLSFFPVPKPLLLFLLGPLANPFLAFLVSAFVSAGLGSLLYVLTRNLFGRPVALLFSAFSLLDPLKGILTVTSSADLYLSFFLFLSVYFATTQRPFGSSLSLLCSALVKPVTLPCAIYFLFAPGLEKSRRWYYTLLPLLAIPIILLTLYTSVGSVESDGRLFREFTALRDTTAIPPDQVLSFVFWTQLVKTHFPLTAVFGVLGLLLWLSTDRQRLTHPFFLFPLAFLGGYLGLSIVSPYMPLFRFFWPIELWFLAFLSYGIVEGTHRLALGQESVQKAAVCLVLFFLLNDSLQHYFTYRNKFALRFGEGMAFVNESIRVMEREKQADETILTSFTFIPWVMWSLRLYDTPKAVLAVESMTASAQSPQPDWIVYVPTVSANPKTLRGVEQLLTGGRYEVRYQQGTSVLFHKAVLSQVAPVIPTTLAPVVPQPSS
jgi:hypothetical protein